MSATDASVRAVGPDEVRQATAVLTLAFADDPVARFMYPEPEEYLAKFPVLVEAFGSDAFRRGTGRIVEPGHAAALWLPPGLHTDDEALGAVLEQDVPAAVRADVAAMFAEMDVYHPSEPHWYLPLIGVDPALRSRGYGTSLLQEGLAQCDQEHVAAYLESTNPRNISLYRRHGFEALGTIKAGAAPSAVPMLRPAR